MHDANDLVRVVQQVSAGANEAGYPADLMSGTVVNTKPLKIKVEQRFDIGSAQLIVPERLTDHEVKITLEKVSAEGMADAGHLEAYVGTEMVVKMYAGLKTGDHVVMIRQQGGQKFLVADKVV